MKKLQLEQLDFKSYLRICYEDIEPYLIAELERLRNELIQLPEQPELGVLLRLFKISVENLNEIDQSDSIKTGIFTEEREGLCEALYAMGGIVGLREETEYVCQWRDW